MLTLSLRTIPQDGVAIRILLYFEPKRSREVNNNFSASFFYLFRWYFAVIFLKGGNALFYHLFQFTVFGTTLILRNVSQLVKQRGVDT